ncbi:MAG: hypothetical protein KGJ90_02070 [Patescibacteria group bacterium]|nr:hypothetical protein [Patescibacteria group bacterium]
MMTRSTITVSTTVAIGFLLSLLGGFATIFLSHLQSDDAMAAQVSGNSASIVALSNDIKNIEAGQQSLIDNEQRTLQLLTKINNRL